MPTIKCTCSLPKLTPDAIEDLSIESLVAAIIAVNPQGISARQAIEAVQALRSDAPASGVYNGLNRLKRLGRVRVVGRRHSYLFQPIGAPPVENPTARVVGKKGRTTISTSIPLPGVGVVYLRIAMEPA